MRTMPRSPWTDQAHQISQDSGYPAPGFASSKVRNIFFFINSYFYLIRKYNILFHCYVFFSSIFLLFVEIFWQDFFFVLKLWLLLLILDLLVQTFMSKPFRLLIFIVHCHTHRYPWVRYMKLSLLGKMRRKERR